jgi:uncharacterized protein (DUF983 family)
MSEKANSAVVTLVCPRCDHTSLIPISDKDVRKCPVCEEDVYRV